MSLNHHSQAIPAFAIASLFTLGACSTFAASLTYIANTSKKIEQVSGPCDWVSWDPKTIYGAPGPCGQTASQWSANQVLAQGLGYSFEDTVNKNLIFLFGDTVGVQSGVTLNPNPAQKQFIQFNAKDTMAKSKTATGDEVFNIRYLTQPAVPTAPLFITSGGSLSQLPPQPDGMQPNYIANGTPVAMAADDIATSGISINGQTYLIVQTGSDATNKSDPYANSYSVLVSFDGVSTFTPGRTISESYYRIVSTLTPDMICTSCKVPTPGHFVFTALYEAPLAVAQQLGLAEPAILIYGNGQFRQSSLYLSYIPESAFWSGLDASGNSATRYFTGYQRDGKTPTWSSSELDAKPIVWDNPPTGAAASPDPGTIGNTSVTFDTNTNLWLMTYDGGHQIDPATGKPSEATKGVYFTYAKMPWGPWLTPQLIYNACQAHSYAQGFGDFIFYHTYDQSNPKDNTCPTALPSGIMLTKEAYSGPAGPIIGSGLDPFGSEAFTKTGGPFAPEIIGRFTERDGNTLRVFYNLSTWNPYTVVKMESDFTIK